MADELNKIVISQLEQTRKEVGILHEKINNNHLDMIKMVHKIDARVVGNKMKIGVVFSGISIFWGIVLNLVYKKL